MGTKTIDSTRAAQELAGCTLLEGSLILNIRRGCECSLPPALLSATTPHCTPSPHVSSLPGLEGVAGGW